MESLKVIGLAALMALAIGACSTDMSEPEVIKKANAYIQKQDYKGAIITLKSYIKSHPDAAESRILAGNVYLNSGDYWSAEKEFSKAIENGAERNSFAPSLAKTLFYKGDSAQLLQLPTNSLQADDRSEVLAYQGLSLVNSRDYDAARVKLIEAEKYSESSGFVDAVLAKASLLQGRESEAQNLVDKALKASPECHFCWSVLGDIDFSKADYQKSVESYSKSIESGSVFSEDYFKRALSLIYLGNYDQAKSDLSKINEIYGESAGTEFAYGLIEYNQKNYREASVRFEKSLNMNSQHMLSVFYMAMSQYILGNYERAEFFGNQLISFDKSNDSANALMASILAKRGRFSEAADYLTEQYQRNKKIMGFYASLLIEADRSAEAIEILNEMALDNPDSPELMTQLGSVMLSVGDQAGVEKLKAAIEIDPNYYYADSIMALNYLQNEEFEKAIEVAESIKKANSELSLPDGIIGRAYLAKGDSEKALEAFSEGCNLTPGDTYTCLSYGALKVQSGDLDEAKEAYREVIKVHPKLPQAYISLSAIYASEGEFDEFTGILRDGVKNTDSLAPRLVLSRFYFSSSQANKVFPLFQGVESQYGANIGMYDVLAKSYLQVKNYQLAKFNLEKLVELQSDSAEFWYLMSAADAGLQNAAGYERALKKSLEIDPAYYPARLVKARTAIMQEQLEEAQRHYEYLNEEEPSGEDTLKVRASIQAMSGDESGALNTYKTLFSDNATLVNMMLLSQQYWNVGDQKAALETRKSWAEKHKDSVPAQMALADVYVSTGKTDEVVKQYKRVLELDQSNFVALNNLAWFLKDNAPEEALGYSERAYRINPESLDVLDTMALVLKENGDYPRAKRTIDKVVDREPDNLTFKYHRALIQAGSGDKDAAKKILVSLVDSDFPEKGEAEDLLKSINQ